MRYSLWNRTKTRAGRPRLQGGLLPVRHPAADQPRRTRRPARTTPRPSRTSASRATRGRPSLKMGTSPGWRDVYNKGLVVPVGGRLGHVSGRRTTSPRDADPDNLLWEGGGAQETNARAFANTPGDHPRMGAQGDHHAADRRRARTSRCRPPSSAARATRNLRFKIVDPPDHGTLGRRHRRPVHGHDGDGTRPRPATPAPTPSRYQAIYNGYGYPLNPPTADGEPRPAAHPVGRHLRRAREHDRRHQRPAAARRSANLSGGVTWSTTGGSVSPTGLLTAPGDPPAASR